MNQQYCQSCGMPLENHEILGTNQDGSKNNEYCIHCYQQGAFNQHVTMDEMMKISLEHMKLLFKNAPDFNEKEALDKMNAFFPKLKRWSGLED